MSRIGKKPIEVPAGVEVKIDGQNIFVKGPKGNLEREIHENIKIEQKNNEIIVFKNNDKAENLYGLSRTLIANMIEGVTNGFSKTLLISGVGYRAQLQGKKLVLTLGYSHPVEMEAPEGITFEVPNATTIIVKGADKELVGQVTADIRSKRLPEVYRGKGIRYEDEIIKRKEGKAGKTA